MSSSETIRVWDVLVRLSHWLLVAGVALAWFTSEGGGIWHDYTGYAVLAVVVVRVCWGFAGTRYARFSHFVRSVSHTADYARSVVKGSARRYIGHNPLAGWMAVALLVMLSLVCATGWLYTTDRFWGVEWVEELHEACANILLVLIALHIAGAIATSRHTKENLIATMFHGRKRTAVGDDID